MLRSLFATAFIATGLIATSLGIVPAFADDTIVIEGPWSRATAPRQPTSGAFLTIYNHGDTADRLIDVSSPGAQTVDLHRTAKENGVMKMRPAGAIDIPAQGMVSLAPGGLHIMLIGLTQPLKKGATLPITLTFEHAGEITIEAVIQSAGSPGHDHTAHDHTEKKK
ncbi:MAG: copper chaperone PCu(A)C [Alphaproteobacteria bacterium]